jgi:isopenicillin N synthase-like dioxygenase
VTHGAIIATTHRVVSPPEVERFSLPFFQKVGWIHLF